MDFPSHPKGWVPLTMEEKRVKEQERIEKRVPSSITYSKTRREEEWEPIHNLLDTYSKQKAKDINTTFSIHSHISYLHLLKK